MAHMALVPIGKTKRVQVLAQSGVILISWQHEAIVEIARYLVASHEPKATISRQMA